MDTRRRAFSQVGNVDMSNKRPRLDASLINKDARAGTIEKLVLKNFMCHSHLEVVFEGNTNFVIGRNGSGKSAILVALVVGLGAKAAVTCRGKSIKNFIKVGKPSATIEITLRNVGSMAYQPHIFGDSITIQRHIVASGASNYKIRSSTGEVVSTQSRDIQKICVSLNIQVDNPVCILNQDTSRNFLSSADPQKKFTLFMKATGLETLAMEYEKTNSNKQKSVALLKEKFNHLHELEVELKELKSKYETLKSLVRLQEKVQALEFELLWAKARDAENEYNEKKNDLDSLNNKVLEHTERLSTGKSELEEINNKVAEVQREIAELSKEYDAQRVPERNLEVVISQLEETLRLKEREKRILIMDIERKSKNCADIESQIKNFSETTNKKRDENLKRLKEMSSIEEKLKGIESLIETTRNDQFQLQNSVRQKDTEGQTLKQESSECSRKFSSIENELRNLKQESNNSLMLYGQHMPQIVQEIHRLKSQFIEMPRGPLGSYIKVRDKKWALAAEEYFKAGLLHAFVVSNTQDRNLLLKIFDKYCSRSKPTIITTKFVHKVYDVSSNLVHPAQGAVRLFDAIEISDPVVANCIIDQSGLEGILLFSEERLAQHCLIERSRVPTNCTKALTKEGHLYYPDPNYKTYAAESKNVRYLQASTKDLILGLEQKLIALNVKKESIQKQYGSVKEDVDLQKKMLGEVTAKLDKLSRAKVVLERKHSELKSTPEEDVGNYEYLISELKDLEAGLYQKQSVQQKIEQDIADISEKMAENQSNLTKIKSSHSGFQERITVLENELKQISDRRREISMNEKFEMERLRTCKRKVEQAERICKEKEQIVETLCGEASKVGERLDNIRSVRALVEEIKKLKTTLRNAENTTEQVEELGKRYQELLGQHRVSTEKLDVLQETTRELQVACNSRKRHYKETEDYFLTYIKHCFTSILKFRQFKGTLEIDMAEGKLDLIVLPQQGSQGVTPTANLSGGERSFSTVAFLYSLWQCMDFPFYFLDEFDVYMDKVNRTKIIEVLIHHSKTRPHLQFVFLTPQDISFIKDEAVAIHRLEDPVRYK